MLAIPASPCARPGRAASGYSVGLGLLMGFTCWVVLSASLSLGRKGMLGPACRVAPPGPLRRLRSRRFSAAWAGSTRVPISQEAR